MYSVVRNKKIKKNRKVELEEFDGFIMPSRKGFVIEDQLISEIKVIDKKLAHPLVSKKVFSKYQRLISYLTELLVSDDDTGDTFREALNQIEKFRLEIKNKYRGYLKQKELELMSKQLLTLQKAAKMRLYEIQESYMASKGNGKNR